MSSGISGIFLALRSRVAGLGFFGFGVALGVALGVADGVALGVADGVALGVADGVALGVADGLSDGVAEGVAESPDGDSEAVALEVFTLITPTIPPATSATARSAITGMRNRGSFTTEVCHETHKSCVLWAPSRIHV